jgi:hypothetical protein
MNNRHTSETQVSSSPETIQCAIIGGKMKRQNPEIMVRDDPRLQRPYVVVADPDRRPDARYDAAQVRTVFLSPETQDWPNEFGRGEFDDKPLFLPIDLR